eukprot:9494089-Pyramimonas_sp.AAC.1
MGAPESRTPLTAPEGCEASSTQCSYTTKANLVSRRLNLGLVVSGLGRDLRGVSVDLGPLEHRPRI